MRIKEIIEIMGVCFDRLEKYNAFQIMNEWLPRQSETFQEQVKKRLTHKVEEYTEGSAEIYKKIFGNIPERFREEKDFREIEYLPSEEWHLPVEQIVHFNYLKGSGGRNAYLA